MSTRDYIKKYIFVIIPVIIVGLALGAIFLGFLGNTPPLIPSPQKVELVKVVKTPVKLSYQVIGLLEAEQSVELKARVSGFLVDKKFQEGDRVKGGEVLFQIEPDQYQSALVSAEAAELSAQAQLTKSQLDFDRLKDLYLKHSSPKSDYDAAQANLGVAKATLLSAQAQVSQARLNLDYAAIKSPFDGQVSDTPFSSGALLGPESGVLATVVSLDPIVASFGISDKLMSEWRLTNEASPLFFGGDHKQVRAHLILNGNSTYELPGEITYVAPLLDRQTDTIKIKARFDNPKIQLVPGQTVVVSLEPVTPPVVLLAPKAAVMNNANGRFVYVTVKKPADPEKGLPEALVAEIRSVTVGAEYEGGFEITSGLDEGEEIITQGLMSRGAMLRNGSPVEVVEPQATSEPSGDVVK